MASTSSHSHRQAALVQHSGLVQELAHGWRLLLRVLLHRGCGEKEALLPRPTLNLFAVRRFKSGEDAAPWPAHKDAIKSPRHVSAMIHGCAVHVSEPAVLQEKIECL